MFPRTLLSRSVLILAVLSLAVGTRTGHAQRLEDGWVAFKDKANATRTLQTDLFRGTIIAAATDKRHQEAIEMAAKAVTYPLRWETVGRESPPPGALNKLVEEFEGRLDLMKKAKANTAQMQQLYCRQVIERAGEVILKSKPIAGINAARILSKIPERILERGIPQSDKSWLEDVQPRLAEGNAEYFAGVLLSLLDNPKLNDGIKYYVLRSLSSLLALQKLANDLLKKETVEKSIRAAMQIVEKKVQFPKAALRAETEREKILHREVEGYKVLRREAIKVVAQSPSPAIGEKDRPALTLARVAGYDESIVPSPRLDERIEAFIGLAKMSGGAAKLPDYQVDYVAFEMARFIETFGLQAKENANTKAVSLRVRPWKVDAARLGEALEGLKAELKNDYVQQAIGQCLLVLRPIENGETGEANVLGNWLAKNAPPGKGVFKAGPDSTVKPAATEPASKGPEEKEK
jgi:hypothetical protein